jgi:hypothetical protein
MRGLTFRERPDLQALLAAALSEPRAVESAPCLMAFVQSSGISMATVTAVRGGKRTDNRAMLTLSER